MEIPPTPPILDGHAMTLRHNIRQSDKGIRRVCLSHPPIIRHQQPVYEISTTVRPRSCPATILAASSGKSDIGAVTVRLANFARSRY